MCSKGMDPLTTNLLVADDSRTDKTICLAVSPSLKALGVPSRPRLFEAKMAIEKYEKAHNKSLSGKGCNGHCGKKDDSRQGWSQDC